MKPYLWHPKLVIKLIVMPCDKRKPGNAKIRVLKVRNVSKNGVKIKRCALLHRDLCWQIKSENEKQGQEKQTERDEKLSSFTKYP